MQQLSGLPNYVAAALAGTITAQGLVKHAEEWLHDAEAAAVSMALVLGPTGPDPITSIPATPNPPGTGGSDITVGQPLALNSSTDEIAVVVPTSGGEGPEGLYGPAGPYNNMPGGPYSVSGTLGSGGTIHTTSFASASYSNGLVYRYGVKSGSTLTYPGGGWTVLLATLGQKLPLAISELGTAKTALRAAMDVYAPYMNASGQTSIPQALPMHTQMALDLTQAAINYLNAALSFLSGLAALFRGMWLSPIDSISGSPTTIHSSIPHGIQSGDVIGVAFTPSNGDGMYGHFTTGTLSITVVDAQTVRLALTFALDPDPISGYLFRIPGCQGGSSGPVIVPMTNTLNGMLASLMDKIKNGEQKVTAAFDAFNAVRLDAIPLGY